MKPVFARAARGSGSWNSSHGSWQTTLTLLAGPQSEEREIMAALRTYVRDEYKDKRQQDVDTSTWPILCA